MSKTKKFNLRALTECSIMVALATVLSIVKILELPYGGSVTIASMLPIIVAVYRHGGAWGFGVAITNSAIQLLLGLKNFSYFTTWQSLVALAVFDYILAFTVFILAPVFKKAIKNQSVAMLLGTLLASFLRYVCHVISGATIWAGLSIPTEAALLYSLSYNATYMVPETVVLVLTTAYVFSVVDFKLKVPTRVKKKEMDKVSACCYIGAGVSILGALIADTVMVFSKLQDAESGEFVITHIKDVNFLAVGIVSAAVAVVAAALILYAAMRDKKSSNANSSAKESVEV